jgi:hypothetical protein
MTKNRIDVSRDELRKAFLKHYKIGRIDKSPSHNLLLFYAVECGLKSLYIRKCKCNNTRGIEESITSNGHNLAYWLKALTLSAQVTEVRDPKFRLLRDGRTGSERPISVAHQAWRYGALIDNDDENRLLIWIKSVSEWIEREI